MTPHERGNYVEPTKTGALGQGYGLAKYLKGVNNVLINTYKNIPLLPHLNTKPHTFRLKDIKSRD